VNQNGVNAAKVQGQGAFESHNGRHDADGASIALQGVFHHTGVIFFPCVWLVGILKSDAGITKSNILSVYKPGIHGIIRPIPCGYFPEHLVGPPAGDRHAWNSMHAERMVPMPVCDDGKSGTRKFFSVKTLGESGSVGRGISGINGKRKSVTANITQNWSVKLVIMCQPENPTCQSVELLRIIIHGDLLAVHVCQKEPITFGHAAEGKIYFVQGNDAESVCSLVEQDAEPVCSLVEQDAEPVCSLVEHHANPRGEAVTTPAQEMRTGI